MNLLFLSLIRIHSIREHGIYQDLLRQFIEHGHTVYIVSAEEKVCRRMKLEEEEPNVHIIFAQVGKIQKTNVIQKGINTILLEIRLENVIRKQLKNIQMDLVLYPTPPVTFANVVQYIKKRGGAKTYLMLKDIHPQGAVDLGVLKKSGFLGFLYKYFLKKEKKLYQVSDKIGCMSEANVNYILKHNPDISKEKLEIFPNSIEVQKLGLDCKKKKLMRDKYGLPQEKKIFVYGGNLGKAQGISFLIDCLKTQINNPDAFFLIIGNGTEYEKLKEFFNTISADNMELMTSIPKDNFDQMIASCDVGMIFLDHRFTIPNFPSRLLSYMQARLPVLACTDPNTDIGKVITNGGFGWWCESNDIKRFGEVIDECVHSDIVGMGNIGYQYLLDHYTAEKSYKIIMKNLN